MFKPFLLTIACFATVQSFSQSPEIKDSTLKPTVKQYVAKNLPSSVPLTITTLKIYPNPAKNKITLDVTGFEPGMAVVKITDAKGKIWRDDNRLLTNGTEEITMFLFLQPGIYFISVSEKNKVVKKKLLIL